MLISLWAEGIVSSFQVYMTYVQALYGGGGWPLSVFLSPDLKPLMGGTYFPPDDKYGRPGFKTILRWANVGLWRAIIFPLPIPLVVLVADICHYVLHSVTFLIATKEIVGSLSLWLTKNYICVLLCFPLLFYCSCCFRKVKDAWDSKRDILVKSGAFAIEQLTEALSASASSSKVPDELLQNAMRLCAEQVINVLSQQVLFLFFI